MTQDTIYITGAGSGIGKEIARRYARMGANLALFDLRFEENSQAIAESTRHCRQQKIGCYEADVTDYSALETQLTEAEAEIGLPNVALHCAGIQKAAPFESASQNDFEKIVGVNLFGSRNFAQGCIPLLKKQVKATRSEARLVFVASMAGLMGTYAYTAYSASKFGVVGLAQTLRMELMPCDIRVQVVCPPEVDTPMVQEELKTIHPVTSKLKSMTGTLTLEQAVNDIMDGLICKHFYIIPGKKARLVFCLGRLLPVCLMNAVADAIIKNELSQRS